MVDAQPWMIYPAHNAAGEPVYDPETGVDTVAHLCAECGPCSTPKNIVCTLSGLSPCGGSFAVSVNEPPGGAGYGRDASWDTNPDWTGGAYDLQQIIENYPCDWFLSEAAGAYYFAGLLEGDSGVLDLDLWGGDHAFLPLIGIMIHVRYWSGGGLYYRFVEVYLMCIGEFDGDSYTAQFPVLYWEESNAKPFDCCDDAWGGLDTTSDCADADVGMDGGTVSIDGECSSEE